MFHNENLYKNFDDFVNNSIQSLLVRDVVQKEYLKVPEYFSYISDIDNTTDKEDIAFRYLFKYWYITKQLEEC